MRQTPRQYHDFQRRVWQYYDRHGRDMPWRRDTSLYSVLVSELMLQQTQVARVITKFEAFVERFPDVTSLAIAPLADVIIMWQGLGYNRRAKYLHDAAQLISKRGEPRTRDELMTLPGVGPNTAGAIMAYTYNQPEVFIETNIRTVYIHEFFPDRQAVTDREITDIVTLTLDHDNPREWYWAVMDYGAYLKQTDARLGQSKQYKKQPPLKGSLREMRGEILRQLSKRTYTRDELRLQLNDNRFDAALLGLTRDGLVQQQDDQISLTGSEETS